MTGTGPNRKAYLREIAEEYIESGIGGHHWSEILDKMIEEGHTTVDEIAREYGRDGFQRAIIRPVQKARDGAGRDKFVVTKSGGIVLSLFAGLDDMSRVYWERKRHIKASADRLAIYRQQIIDQHEVDPETLPDPFEGQPYEECDD